MAVEAPPPLPERLGVVHVDVDEALQGEGAGWFCFVGGGGGERAGHCVLRLRLLLLLLHGQGPMDVRTYGLTYLWWYMASRRAWREGQHEPGKTMVLMKSVDCQGVGGAGGWELVAIIEHTTHTYPHTNPKSTLTTLQSLTRLETHINKHIDIHTHIISIY